MGQELVDGFDELAGARVFAGGGEAGLEAFGEVGGDGRVGHGDLAAEDFAGLAVDGDGVVGGQDEVTDGDGAGGFVDNEGLGTTHAGLAHAAGDDGSVRGLTAARGKDALGGDHAGQVVGVGLAAHEDGLDAFAGGFNGLGVVEGDLADGGTRGRRPCRER